MLYALNEQYLNIESSTVVALSICICTTFVVMLPFVVNPLVSLIVTSVLVAIQVEL